MKRGDDDLFHHVIDGGVGFDDRRRSARKRADHAVSEQNAEESADQRRTDHRAEDSGGLVNRTHRLHDAKHGSDNAQRRQRIGERLEIVGGTDGFVMMRLDRVVHDVFDRVRIEIARRDNDKAQRVADQVDQRSVFQQARIIGKDRRGIRIFDMRLDRDGSLDAEHLHQLRHKENGVEKILLFPAWPFEDFNEATTERFQLRTRVADDERADSCAADDEHFVG